MNPSPEQPQRDLYQLSPADAELIDRLLSGERIAGPVSPDQVERADRVRRLLELLSQWQAEDPRADLAGKALSAVIASRPTSLSAEDGEVLDALLSLRHKGLDLGPMPAGSRYRAEKLSQLLSLLDRPSDEPVPKGLVGRTLQAIEDDRANQRRLSIMSANASSGSSSEGGSGLSFGGFRQIATTAALVLMSLSVLLPVLNKSRNDAMIAQCRANLASLGTPYQQFAEANEGQTNLLQDVFGSTEVDGTPIPPSEMNVFAIFDQNPLDHSGLLCPSAADPDTAYYNGQYGPVRVYDRSRPIFADTNPLYRMTDRGMVRKADTPDLSLSNNHGGAGQNVLMSDGSVQWFMRPTFRLDDSEADSEADSDPTTSGPFSRPRATRFWTISTATARTMYS